jgi:DNA-binding transcriptional MerR regulator
MKSATLRIGEIAAHSSVSVGTVRFHERRRLLPSAPRTAGGFRLFTEEAVGRVRFIRQAQEIGFSLDEVGQLLRTAGGASECRRVHDLLREKLGELDERIGAMQRFRGALADHLAACERELKNRRKAAECPVIVGIAQTAHSPAALARKE